MASEVLLGPDEFGKQVRMGAILALGDRILPHLSLAELAYDILTLSLQAGIISLAEFEEKRALLANALDRALGIEEDTPLAS